jgi:hypothetical protein
MLNLLPILTTLLKTGGGALGSPFSLSGLLG